jgi:hypothetical protein
VITRFFENRSSYQFLAEDQFSFNDEGLHQLTQAVSGRALMSTLSNWQLPRCIGKEIFALSMETTPHRLPTFKSLRVFPMTWKVCPTIFLEKAG